MESEVGGAVRRFVSLIVVPFFGLGALGGGTTTTSPPAGEIVVTGRFTELDALRPELQDGVKRNEFTLVLDPSGSASGAGGFRFEHQTQYGKCTGPWVKNMDAQFDGTYAPDTGRFHLTMTYSMYRTEPLEQDGECIANTLPPEDASGSFELDGTMVGDTVTFSWPGMAATTVTRGGSPASTAAERGGSDGGTSGATVALVGGLVLVLLVLVLLGAPGARDLLRRLVARVRGRDRPMSAPSPVYTRTAPSDAAERSALVLQPGNEYQEVGAQGTWVFVDDGRGHSGWVHRAALDQWRQEVIVRQGGPTVTAARERVTFGDPFDTRNPDGRTVTRCNPGDYLLGPRGADGYRPVYDLVGRLIGHVPADSVPPTVISRQP